ncbi:MAG: glycine cleavage system protein H [Planctomycetota bacterium]
MGDGILRYRRAKFSARLFEDRLYTAGHFWLGRGDGDAIWRIGFTPFALRMLGEIVEFDFEVKPGDTIERGQVIGWTEGFKAVADLYSPMAGRFAGHNKELDDDISLLQRSAYDRGWLYAVDGEPDDECYDAQDYADFLDSTIDKMMGQSS